MSQTIVLTASDGHFLSAYHAMPTGAPKGGVVVIQEIFGVNDHVKSVADRFAAEGYEVLAPALYDRAEKGVSLGYGPDDVAEGRKLRARIGWDAPLLDLAAAITELGARGKVGAVGFCWGGSLAFLSACRLNVACAVAYYGGQVAQFVDEAEQRPLMMHFGERDPLIPMTDVANIRAKHPAATTHVYAAGHGFNCEVRSDYDPESSALAWARTRTFFEAHLAP